VEPRATVPTFALADVVQAHVARRHEAGGCHVRARRPPPDRVQALPNLGTDDVDVRTVGTFAARTQTRVRSPATAND
jgi:hypothetical protein